MGNKSKEKKKIENGSILKIVKARIEDLNSKLQSSLENPHAAARPAQLIEEVTNAA